MSPQKKTRSLRLFAGVLGGIGVVAFTAILFFIFRTHMMNMLLRAEDSGLERQITVARSLFERSQRNTVFMANDLAIWEETALFALGKNPDYIKANWPEGTSLLSNYRFNLVVIRDLLGNILYQDTLDYLGDEHITLPADLLEQLERLSQEVLLLYRSGVPSDNLMEHGLSGIAFSGDTAYNLAIVPILTEEEAAVPADAENGPDDSPAITRSVVGTMVLGHVLKNAFFQDLTHFGRAYFRVDRSASLQREANLYRQNDNMVTTEIPLQGLHGISATMRLTSGRTMFAEGRSLLNGTTIVLIGLVLLFAVSMYLLVWRFLLRPVERLSADIGRLDVFDGGLVPAMYSSSREFAALYTSINDMTVRLRQSQVSMDVLQRVLNGIDAYLYVSDLRTDEILFTNDSLRDLCNLESANGLRCWEVLYSGRTGRCENCPLDTLKDEPGRVVVWEETIAATGHSYRNTDCLINWVGGKMAHLHLRVDISDMKQAEQALTRRLEQQELMAAMSQTFISTANTEELIDNALDMAGTFTGVEKIVLARYDELTAQLEVDYSWHNPEKGVAKLSVTSLPFGPGDAMYETLIEQGKPVFIRNKPDTGLVGLEELSAAGVRRLIAVPIAVEGRFWGVLSFDDKRVEDTWTESDTQLITLIGSIISGVFNRKLIENKLLRMSSIADSSPQYISYINSDAEIEYLNRSVQDITGYTEEEVMAGGLALLFGEGAVYRLRRELIPQVLERGHAEFDMVLTRKDGEQRILTFSSFTTGESGRGIGAIAMDITDKLLLERELLTAKEQAEQSSKAKGEFLSRMSHEMRTPLNAIIGMTNIARAAKDIEKKEYCLEKIDSASSHLLGVINDILDMSKIEANKFELSFTEFNFEKMLMRVINVINFRVDEKNQNLLINVAPDVPPDIISDDQRLAQVIANLLSNAVKFTPEEGTITLTAECLNEDNNACTLKISVADTGIGLTPEQASRLFRSFEQADGGIARKFGGTGLGLAISKSIVEMLGGEIWVESEEGNGSVFSFTFVAQRGSVQRQGLLSPDVNWKNLRVLAVDDAPEVREYFAAFAESVNLNCELAADGFEACDKIESGQKNDTPYNIVFADWKMPNMNGIELTRRIKEQYGQETVVIMISATEWSDIEDEAKAAGVDRFVPKPLFPSLLVNCINECIGSEQVVQSEQVAEQEFGDGCFAGRRVLLAEDIDINREIVFSLMEHTGLAIDPAENGEIAVRMFSENPGLYDVILMDIHMPEVDGYEATRRIRALGTEEARTIPIIAMTANVFREDIERCLAAGMNDHIGKPVNLTELMEKLAAYLPGA